MPASRLIKPWSISTTVRNPERLPGFLAVLRDEFEGAVWDNQAQQEFQIHLISKHLYGSHNRQFTSGLSQSDINLIDGEDDVPLADARRIFYRKGYTDPPMRGRTSFKPLEKFGFAAVNPKDSKIQITPLGHEFLNPDADLGDVILRSLLKWQLPNPIDAAGFPAKHGYKIKPFVATLHLIKAVNDSCKENGLNETGISYEEFQFFVPTLIDWEKIGEVAQKLVEIRVAGQSLSDALDYFQGFDLKHLHDYADNAIRYFRLTRFIRFRGNGRYIDLEPRRAIEINALLESDNGSPQSFQDWEDYYNYLCDPNLPALPWQKYSELVEIYREVIESITQLDADKGDQFLKNFPVTSDEKELAIIIDALRKERQTLQRQADSQVWQTTDKTRECAEILAGLSKPRACSPVDLEYHFANALMSLDAAKDIVPNYPVGDDGLPTFTAPGGLADIECFYGNFNVACEVTLMKDSKQWVHETIPVLRHVHEFTQRHNQVTYGLFVAPAIHSDTVNMFWLATKGGYQGEKILIFPVTINQFTEILKVCISIRSNGGNVSSSQVESLFNGMAQATTSTDNSQNWLNNLKSAIGDWCVSLSKEGALV